MYRCSFNLQKEPSQKQLDDEVDRLEEQLRRHIETKYGCDDLRRPKEALRRLFEQFDNDGSEYVGRKEFKTALALLNFVDQDRAMDAMFDRYDRDDSGQLSFKEFSDGIWGLVPVPAAAPQCRAVIEKVSTALRKHGNGFRGLTMLFRKMDGNGNKKLDRKEMDEGIKQCGIELSPEELDMIMEFFDRDGDGTVSVTEFVRQVRGKMSDWRQQLIHMAFSQIDVSGDGAISFAEAKSLYRADRHPSFISGAKTQEEILAGFISAFDKDGDGSLSYKEFLDYYKDISAGICDDAEFEQLVRNEWKIPKSKQKATGPSALHATVTFTDGSKQTLAVEGSADASSVRAIEVALRKQGVSNIAKVSLG